jgi:hypothetical protein
VNGRANRVIASNYELREGRWTSALR